MEQLLRIETRLNGPVFEVKLCERMTFSDHAQFKALLKEISQAAPKTCVFDLSKLDSIDSAGLGMLIVAQDAAKKAGWTLKLRSPQAQVRSLLGLGNFDKLITVEG